MGVLPTVAPAALAVVGGMDGRRLRLSYRATAPTSKELSFVGGRGYDCHPRAFYTKNKQERRDETQTNIRGHGIECHGTATRQTAHPHGHRAPLCCFAMCVCYQSGSPPRLKKNIISIAYLIVFYSVAMFLFF